MDDLFKKAAKQVPALGLMVVVVFIFIRYIGQQSQNSAKYIYGTGADRGFTFQNRANGLNSVFRQEGNSVANGNTFGIQFYSADANNGIDGGIYYDSTGYHFGNVGGGAYVNYNPAGDNLFSSAGGFSTLVGTFNGKGYGLTNIPPSAITNAPWVTNTDPRLVLALTNVSALLATFLTTNGSGQFLTGIGQSALTFVAATNGANVATTQLSVTNGFASYSSNALAPSSITFPATTVNWTNTFGKNIFLFVDNTGVTGTAVKINGKQIFGSILPIDLTIPLQPGEWFSETYTVGTPTATWKPY